MGGEEGHDPAPWCPSGVMPLGAPKEKPLTDQRFRIPRAQPEVSQDARERSRCAVAGQCMYSKIPGYTGFIPSAKAEDIYGRTQADVGRTAVKEQARRRDMRETATREALAAMNAESTKGFTKTTPGLPDGVDVAPAPDEHPLGKSQSHLVRNHWVPTIPGYGGYIPAKHAENICGGGIIHTCKMAGRAIAERQPALSDIPLVTREDDLPRGRLSEYHYEGHHIDHREKLAADIREHCSKQIPGYQGHIPRVKGESIYGGRLREVNIKAADYVEDRIFNRENHGNMIAAQPQAPRMRQLRL
eukprot:TRINITY_DN84031_c0_g1_i1.p1 TRINITY_DN84031_c0_g1~~TRINITY_DN84031_c0_g1_i1.p1  ORF type:complete len:301 (-),score=48.59 TRINITY_DN84031_c0_g1_i1:93-995(-)